MSNKQKTKTPVTYYGGKQRMCSDLTQLIPAHRIYVEPFFGGGALFFHKPKSHVEVINDKNSFVVNFYKTVKTDFLALQALIQTTPCSRAEMLDAYAMYERPHLFTALQKAWAFHTLCNQGYGGAIGSSWGYGVEDNKRENNLLAKRENFTDALRERLETTQIECADAVHIIKLRDRTDTFFYCDPPYVGANMGHYAGYMQRDFDALLEQLSQIKGKFLLSSYPNERLSEYTKRHGWHTIEKDMVISLSKNRRRKDELPT